MDSFLELNIKALIKSQITCMAAEYSSRSQCLWEDGTKYIWIDNTDYLVEILPNGTNTLISPIDSKLINQIYALINDEQIKKDSNIYNKKANQLIFMYYENHYLEWRDWYFIKNGDKYIIISDPLGDYDHTPMEDYLNNILELL